MEISSEVVQMCDTLHMSQIVTKPTRVTPNSETLIDLILMSQTLGDLFTSVQPVAISDHSLVYVILKEHSPKFVPKISYIRSFRKFNEEDV